MDHGAYIKQYGNGKSPHPQYHRHKLDITHKIDVDGIIRHQKCIRTLIWEIDLGCIDINTEVSFISKHI